MKMRSLGGFFIILLLAAGAFAAVPPDSGRMLRESDGVPKPSPRRDVPEFQVETEQEPAAGGGVRIKVNGFNFIGSSVFSEAELAAMVSDLVGMELRLAELDESLKRITGSYREQGYILARALVPTQTIKSGENITIEIVEGILESVEIDRGSQLMRTPDRLLRTYADRAPVGEPVKKESLVPLAIRVGELPGVDAKIILEPGQQKGGTKARVLVTEEKPYSVYFDTDNHGNYATGYYRFGTRLELYSPFKLGDSLNFRVQTSDSGETVNVKTGYSMPVGKYGARLGLGYQWMTYDLGRDFEVLDAKGRARNFAVSLTHPLVRSIFMTLDATVAYELTLLEDKVNIFQVNNERETKALHAGASGWATDSFWGGGSTTFNVFLTSGDLEFDDHQSRLADQALDGLKTEGSYNKVSLSFYREQFLSGKWSLYFGGHGQIADNNLDSSEQVSLGGGDAVRAYPVGEASADEGYVVTAELRYRLDPGLPFPGDWQLVGFVDDGRAWIDYEPIAGRDDNERHLAGVGVGVNWFEYDNFNVKTSISWKTTGKPTSDTKREDGPMAYFAVVKRF